MYWTENSVSDSALKGFLTRLGAKLPLDFFAGKQTHEEEWKPSRKLACREKRCVE